jgi:hypothetical protein
MSTVPLAIRDFARRLIVLEAARDNSLGALGGGAACVCDQLRVPLVKLAGTAGFRSVMSRALAMARAEFPSLIAVQVNDDGSLVGLNALEHNQESGASDEAGVVVVAQLLGLLVTFIGEPLTVRLVRDIWSEATMIGLDMRIGE